MSHYTNFMINTLDDWYEIDKNRKLQKKKLWSPKRKYLPYQNICPSFFTITIQIFKEHVEKNLADKASKFDKTIELLKITSTLLKNFKSKASYRYVKILSEQVQLSLKYNTVIKFLSGIQVDVLYFLHSL